MKKTLFFFAIIFSFSACVVFVAPSPDSGKQQQQTPVVDTAAAVQDGGFGFSAPDVTPTQYATVRPDQQPEQDYPTPANWEFYSQKGGTPLRRANADSVGKMFRPDIAALDTTTLNRFVQHGDSAFYKNFYGDSLYLGGGGANLYNSNGSVPDSVYRIAIVDTAATLYIAFGETGDGGIRMVGRNNNEGPSLTVSSDNEINYISLTENSTEIVSGVTTKVGDVNQTLNGMGIDIDADEMTIGDVFTDGNIGVYISKGSEQSYIFGNDGAGNNVLGIDYNAGQGIYIAIDDAPPTEGKTLRSGGDGTFYFSDFDSTGVNIYNGDGTIPADGDRVVSIDSNATFYINYANAAPAIEIYSGEDTDVADNGQVSISSTTGNNSTTISAESTNIYSTSGIQIGETTPDDNAGVGIDIFYNSNQYQIKLGNVFGDGDRFVSYDADEAGNFLVQNAVSSFEMDDGGNVTTIYGDGTGSGTFLAQIENGSESAIIQQNLSAFTVAADDGNDLSYQISANRNIGRVLFSGTTAANATAAVVATADDSGNGKSASVVLSISDPDAVVLNSAAIEIDTNGVKIQTVGGTGAAGDLLQSNGLYTYWTDTIYSASQTQGLAVLDGVIDMYWDSTQNGVNFHDQDERRAFYQVKGEFSVYGSEGGGSPQYYINGDETSGRIYMGGIYTGGDREALIDAQAVSPGQPATVSLTAIDSASTSIYSQVRVDSNGVKLYTNATDGTEGDLLMSNGSYSRWGGAGTFNADQLSYTPGSPDVWTAVVANRYTASFSSGATPTLTPSESVTEIIIDSTATTSTLNINYTPDARYNGTFTTVRYIYNDGSGACTVATNQSWKFTGSVATTGTFSIAAGEVWKIVWRPDAVAANARFYAIKLQ